MTYEKASVLMDGRTWVPVWLRTDNGAMRLDDRDTRTTLVLECLSFPDNKAVDLFVAHISAIEWCGEEREDG